MFKALRQVAQLWGRADVGAHAAATAYFAIFSLAPLVVIAIAVAGAILGQETAQSAIFRQFGDTFGPEFREFAEALVENRDPATGFVSTIIGGALVLIGASGIFRALRDGLDRIFANAPKVSAPGLLNAVVQQLVSIGMVLSVGFLMLASLLVSTVLATLADYIHALHPGLQFIAGVLDFVLTYGLVSGFLALLIAFLPSRKIHARPALAGGLMAGASFVTGKYAMSLYFALANPASAFGAASAMVVVVLWAYFLALGLFLSAIFARIYFGPTYEDPSVGEAPSGHSARPD